MQRWFSFSTLAIIAMFISPWSCVRAYQVNPAHYDIQKVARLDQKYSSKQIEPYGPSGSYKRYNPDYDDWMYYAKEPQSYWRKFRKQYSGPGEFSYDEQNPTGPSKWKYLEAKCGGARQSPIPIETKAAVMAPVVDKFETFSFDKVPELIRLENTGHSVKFACTFKPGETPMMAGGPLAGFFILDHVHFHWGLSNDRGSEHTLNGERYPMEMHIVMYDGRYSSFDEAQSKPDGLAVLMFMIEIGPPNGPLFIAPFISNIIEPNQITTIDSPYTFSLNDLIGDVSWNILSYKGSLTTPPCSETVTWVINKIPIYLRQQEFEALRELHFADGKAMGNNFRPLQSTNTRRVMYYPEE